MRVLLAGDFSPHLDEGFKNVSHHFAAVLSAKHSVVTFDVKQVPRLRDWRRAAALHAEIIHLVAAPTIKSLGLGFLLRAVNRGSRLVISALRPETMVSRISGPVWRGALRLAKPSLVLVQDPDTAVALEGAGVRTAVVPNGVDLSRFRPPGPGQKRAMKIKYGLDPDRPVVLHVGHLQPARNLAVLAPLVESGVTVAVAGSLYMGTDRRLISDLQASGLTIFIGFQSDIHELYMAADCYAFPTQPGDSLAMPLSILEAMAADLPVVTTRFPAIFKAFPEGPGLRFAAEASAIPALALEVLRQKIPARTRDLVEPFSWNQVGRALDLQYLSLAS